MATTDGKIRAGKAMLRDRRWAILRGLPFVQGDSPDISRILDIAARFGRPSDRDGGIAAWRVRPLTDDPAQTFSVRTGHAPLHTDAQYRPVPESIVCLFAVRPAGDGGAARVLTLPDALAALDGHPTGSRLRRQLARPAWSWRVPPPFAAEPPFRAAVLAVDGTIRWRRDNLASHLDDELRRAADDFGRCLESAPGITELPLESGDVLVLDNRRTLHGRTAFADPHRLMVRVRLWRTS
jgi:alpha-ketoglutarate-dependent taurine dioxygenase